MVLVCTSVDTAGFESVGVGVTTEGRVGPSTLGVAGVDEGVGCEDMTPGFALSSDLSSAPSTRIRAFFNRIYLLKMTRLSISGCEYYIPSAQHSLQREIGSIFAPSEDWRARSRTRKDCPSFPFDSATVKEPPRENLPKQTTTENGSAIVADRAVWIAFFIDTPVVYAFEGLHIVTDRFKRRNHRVIRWFLLYYSTH